MLKFDPQPGVWKPSYAFLSELERRMPAPEELSGTPPERQREERADRGPRRGREDFDAGQWFEIDLGRKQRAEPRWLTFKCLKTGSPNRAL